MNLKIFYEDNHVIVVYKEAGTLSQGDIRGVPSLYDHVKEYIKLKYNKPGKVFLGVVHRLDMPVSGVMVFAKTSKAARRLHSEMLRGNIKKFYIALVEPIAGIPDGWQLFQDNLKKVYGGSRASAPEEGKTAKLSCIRVKEYGRRALVCVALHSGRKHQIRVQLALRKMPITGDPKYGHSAHPQGIMLHAMYLKFPHPVKDEEIEIIDDIPERFYSVIQRNDDMRQSIIDTIYSPAQPLE
ncbi:MAG: RNA pseudouridine synthase [Leptospirales bacterium]|nr:RNA pseudouridine synthase [Leptospirales bacterium]